MWFMECVKCAFSIMRKPVSRDYLLKPGSTGPGQAGECPEGRCQERRASQSTLVKFGQRGGPRQRLKVVPPSGPAPPPPAGLSDSLPPRAQLLSEPPDFWA